MGIFSRTPAAKERAAFDAAETRLQAVADRLGQVQRDLAQARARLASLKPGAVDLEADIEQAAQAFGQEHATLSARVAFLVGMRERLTGELAQARRDLVAAEGAVAESIKSHFSGLAGERLQRMVATVGPELEALAVELARASGNPNDAFPLESVLAELKTAIIGKSGDFCVGLRYAEGQTPKVPAPPRSALLTGAHRSGQDLDRLSPLVDLQAIRQNLAGVTQEMERAEHQLFAAGRDVPAARRRDLETIIERCRQSREQYEAELAAAEQAQALAA